MANCKDVIITIANYNTQDSFDVALRPKGSLIDFNNSTMVKKATTGVVVFKSVPGSEWEVAVKRTCSEGTNISLWQGIIGTSCNAPTTLTVSNTGSNEVSIGWQGTAPSYEIEIDSSGQWLPAANPYIMGNITQGSIYTIGVRSKCANNTVTQPTTSNFNILPAGPYIGSKVLRIECESGFYKSHKVRISLSGGIAAAGKIYRINYYLSATNNQLLLDYTVQPGDTLEKILNVIASKVTPLTKVLTTTYGYIEFDSRDMLEYYQAYQPCNNVNKASAYICSII